MKKLIALIGLFVALALSVSAHEPNAPEFQMDTAKQDSPPATQTEITKKADTTKMKDTAGAKKEVPWTTNKSGLKWRDIVVGKGTEAKMQMPVQCHYTVWLSDSTGTKGKLIQTSKESTPLNCTIGVALIEGWSEGMLGMKEGGTRELVVPPTIGYGARGRGNMIPPNSTLYFEIVFLNEVKQ